MATTEVLDSVVEEEASKRGGRGAAAAPAEDAKFNAIEAFKKFKQLGGTFYRQRER